MAELKTSELLKRTPLHDFHVRHGARMIAFAGYEMPVQYPSGILKEHLHTRTDAGLFDVSHMGQIALTARSGRFEDAARALEMLVPADVLSLGEGRQCYTVFTNEVGGVIDDLMMLHADGQLRLVVNAACKESDLAHLHAHLEDGCKVELLEDLALIALQGPESERVLAAIAPDIQSMRFMDVRMLTLAGSSCLVSRSGYTGEDGFEISIAASAAEPLCEALLKNKKVEPIGLGARDSLRLEAGLCLYGADLDSGTTPVEAALEWTIPKVRQTGGARAGGFPGDTTILLQLENGPARSRVGLKPEGRAPVRGGTKLFRSRNDEAPIGHVTSGGFGPSVGAPVAMGYVPTPLAAPGTRIFAEVRGKRIGLMVAPIPFVPTHYRHA